MVIENLSLNGCFCENLKLINDNRGSFIKIFSKSKIKEILPGFNPAEMYITRSQKNVIRGMHFQIPPFDHGKIVVCLSGAVTDVLLDLRQGNGYGKVISRVLRSNEINTMYIPRGVAHGFLAHSDDTILAYVVETEYSQEHDRGILWSSIGFEWGADNPIVSQRDCDHPKLSEIKKYSWRI